MSDYEHKFQAAMRELEQTNIWRSNYSPPALRLQRRLGQEARPPHYASFWRTMIGYGFWFGGVWGILMWFAQWRALGYSMTAAVITAAVAGVFFGLMIAGYYAWSRRKHRLSNWDEL